jgi:formamidopyrimidine-DNA glycosylase
VPELPEVETVVRGLGPRLLGLRIDSVEVRHPQIRRGEVELAAGSRVTGVRRWGKFIVVDLRRRRAASHLVIHLGMTGQLLLDGTPGRHTHALIGLEGGRTLLYNDIRRFGRLEFAARLPERLKRLGPDPLELSEAEFVARFRKHRTMAKALLLNQCFLRGMGNIYADESLFRAGIHPRAVAARVRPVRAAGLYRAITEVLAEAILAGGSSISDYVATDGRPGEFQIQHRVYGRGGEPCPACGARIRKILVASRGTHFCPRCQRLPR